MKLTHRSWSSRKNKVTKFVLNPIHPKHMKNFFCFLFAGFAASWSLAQNIEMRNFDWPVAAAIHKLEAAEQKEPAVYLEDRRVVEYIYNAKSESETYAFRYQLIHINETSIIDNFNKIYVAVEHPDRLLSFKARIIGKNGKSTEMLLGEMKPVMEDGQLYMSVPLDGLEKG